MSDFLWVLAVASHAFFFTVGLSIFFLLLFLNRW